MLRIRFAVIGAAALVGTLASAPSSEAANRGRTYVYVAADFHDAGVTGRISVTVSTAAGNRHLCVLDDVPVLVDDLRIGTPTTVTIWSASQLGDHCNDTGEGATSGVATVSL